MKATTYFFLTMIFIAALAAMLGVGLGYNHGRAEGSVEGYGCGRHDAMQTANSDPAEYDLPPCVEIRTQWLWGERWPK